MNYAVVPAHPGYFACWPAWDTAGEKVVALSQSPIIAWAVQLEPDKYETLFVPRPITPVGFDVAGMNDGIFDGAIKTPDGCFHHVHGRVCPDEAGIMEVFQKQRAREREGEWVLARERERKQLFG
jgi:hypothetical protein